MHPIYRLQSPQKGPDLPSRFSYSTLIQIERCPNQWWLMHASYSHIEEGYPRPVYSSNVIGAVIHTSLNIFLEHLNKSGNPSPSSEAFKTARSTFPIRKVIRAIRELELAKLEVNPRTNPEVIARQVTIDNCINGFKVLLYKLIDKSDFGCKKLLPMKEFNLLVSSSSMEYKHNPNLYSPNHAIHTATVDRVDDDKIQSVFSEYRLFMDDPPLIGIVDLVLTGIDGDVLVEFKTGVIRQDHEMQTRIYNVLWSECTSRLVKWRKIIYTEDEEKVFPGLNSQELEIEKGFLRQKVGAVQRELSLYHPTANPTSEFCGCCTVRQICDPYWYADVTRNNRWTEDVIVQMMKGKSIDNYRDIEIYLASIRTYPGGFISELNFLSETNVIEQDNIKIICNIPDKFYPGPIDTLSRVRILGTKLFWDGYQIHLIMSQTSEMFWS